MSSHASRAVDGPHEDLCGRERLGAPIWQDHGLVFASETGTAMAPRNVVRRWHALCDAAGIARRPFHHLRHTSATFLLTGGMPLEAVSKLLGHSTVAVTANVYAEIRQRLLAPAAGIIDGAMRRSSAGA